MRTGSKMLSPTAGAYAGSLALVLLAGLLYGCGSATSQGQVELQQPTSTGESTPSGAAQFLGPDASLLHPGAEGQAALVYFAPNVQWSGYKGILLKPVEFWDSADSKVSLDDQKMLTSYFYNALKTNLGKSFRLVDQPGPGIVTMEVALINAEGATPGLRSLSIAIPQARLLNRVQSFATGHAAFAGSAESAVKVTDSTTGQLLAESVDKRVGGMAISSAAQLQWGDAEAAMDYWAQQIAARAAALKAGKLPGATQDSTSGN